MKKLKDHEKLEAISDWIDNQHNVAFWQNKPSEDSVIDMVSNLRRIAAKIKRNAAASTNNRVMPCNQWRKQSSVVSKCPCGDFDCGNKPCMVTRA